MTSVRQETIAKRLGISSSTVSLALRDAPQVAEETRRQVQAIAEELGYKVRSRRAARTQLMPTVLDQITFVMDFDATDSFYAGVLKGAEQACLAAGVDLHYSRLAADQNLARFDNAEALLLVGTISEATVKQLMRRAIPLVLVDNNLPQLGLDRVLTENAGSLHRSVQYLYDLGHRAIAYVSGPLNHPSFHERLLGYRAAMATLGLTPLELMAEHNEAYSTEAVIQNWLKKHPHTGFSAVIACNDMAAVEVMHALHNAGLAIPGDVSVVGFDDIDLAQLLRPTLTTNHVHRELLGQLGVQLLITRATQPDRPTQAIVQDTVFVVRNSSGPART
jgi:LacI family transcriptional regulator